MEIAVSTELETRLSIHHRRAKKSDSDIKRRCMSATRVATRDAQSDLLSAFIRIHRTLPCCLSSRYIAMADVEMKPADDAKEKKDEKSTDTDRKPVPLTPVAEIKANVVLIERAVSTLEPRFTHRVLRSLAHLRKKLDDKVLGDAISQVYVAGTSFLL